jgi:predicted transcriptional regulator
MTPYDAIIQRKLVELNQICGGAVRTALLADHLCRSDRTMRLYLSRLETLGMVSRRGSRGGWLPA